MKRKGKLTLLGSIFMILAVAVTWTPASAAETIRIGGMDMMTGTMADYGWMMKVGGELAVEHLNAAGGLLGKKVEMKFMDSEWNPQTGIKNAEYLTREYGAKLIYGFSSDVVPGAIIPHLERLDAILIHSHSAVQSLTEEMVYVKGYKYYFRNCVSVVQDGNLPAAYFSKWPDIKTYATLDAWQYGDDATQFFGEYVAKVRPDMKKVADVNFEFGHVNFAPELSAIAAKKPNLIMTTAPGGMGIAAIRQALIMGLFDQPWLKAFFVSMGNHTGFAKAIYKDLKAGRFNGKLWGSARYIWNANDRPANVKFWKAFLKKHKRYPSYPAALGYTSIIIWADAVKKAQSTDPKKLIPILEGYTSNDLPIGEASDDPVFIMRASDHQGLYTTPLGRYVYDPELPVEKIGVLTDFSDIPWQEYYRHPPDFTNPPHDKAYVEKWYKLGKK